MRSTIGTKNILYVYLQNNLPVYTEKWYTVRKFKYGNLRYSKKSQIGH